MGTPAPSFNKYESIGGPADSGFPATSGTGGGTDPGLGTGITPIAASNVIPLDKSYQMADQAPTVAKTYTPLNAAANGSCNFAVTAVAGVVHDFSALGLLYGDAVSTTAGDVNSFVAYCGLGNRLELSNRVFAAPVVTPSVPTNTAVPTISGTTTQGQVLTSTTGSWTNTPTSYAYQWRRGGTAISGATSSTYTLVSADVGTVITVAVIATNGGGSSTAAVSAGTAAIAAPATPVPVNSVAPAITGTPQVGQTLTVSNGTWSNTPTSYAYQWKRAGTNISGATAQTYVPVSADVGNTLTCAVTASNAGGAGAAATSAATVAVTAAVSGGFTRDYNKTDSDTSTGYSGTINAGSGGPVGIKSNKAAPGSASDQVNNVFEVYEGGSANGALTAALNTGSNFTANGVIFRYVDANNWLAAYIANTTFKVVANVASTVSEKQLVFNVTVLATNALEVDLSGTGVTVKFNGATIINGLVLASDVMTATGSGTKHGPFWAFASTDQYIDNVTFVAA